MEPSRLVCPTVATALAGTTTSGFTDNVEVDMPAVQRHLADAADHDIVDHHRRIRFQRTDVRDLDVIHGWHHRHAPPRPAAATSSRLGTRIP